MSAGGGETAAAATGERATDPDPAPARRTHPLLARLLAPVDGASLAVLRLGFGLVMVWEVIRYFDHGWIASQFLEPSFHFTYFGFGWVRPWPGDGLYVHFAALGALALLLALGVRPRLTGALFALGFAHLFLLERAQYLNHFYLVLLVAALFAAVPHAAAYRLDARFGDRLGGGGRRDERTVPRYALWALRFQIAVPYVYGGIAKLSSDWLAGAPMRQWLAERGDIALVGPWLSREPVVLAFVWGGTLLDLLVVPLLLLRRTRPVAVLALLAFHSLNAVLFRIGIFPWLMLFATTIFFAPDWPRRLLRRPRAAAPAAASSPPPARRGERLLLAALAAHVALQLLLPFRHLFYPGDVNWTEEGHRFSWHMKLRDKEGRATFTLTDPATGDSRQVDPRALLNRKQARAAAHDPDLLVQLAHHLAAEARRDGHPGVEVRARARVSLNGRRPQLLVDPTVDLARVERTFFRPLPIILHLTEPLPPPGQRGADDGDDD